MVKLGSLAVARQPVYEKENLNSLTTMPESSTLATDSTAHVIVNISRDLQLSLANDKSEESYFLYINLWLLNVTILEKLGVYVDIRLIRKKFKWILCVS